jgi:membrane protein implicated in regulation of membrane protease activity
LKKNFMLERGYRLKAILMTVPSAYERATACVVSAMAFLIVGLCSLFLGNVPVAVGLLAAALFWLLVALFYLTKEHRQKRAQMSPLIGERAVIESSVLTFD